MEIEIFGLPYLKDGTKIHIKDKNRGKFTKSAKAAGQSVLEHARSVLNNPNATPLLKKRANFARNAAKWKHQHGGTVHYSRLDTKGLRQDPLYRKSFNFKINDKNIGMLQDSMIVRRLPFPQRVATMTNVIAENGGDTGLHDNGAKGFMGWRGARADDVPDDAPGLIHKIMRETLEDYSTWTDGGKGTNVRTGKEMQNLFKNTVNTKQATNALMKGYVRPEKSDYNRRLGIMTLLKKYMR